MPQAASFHKSSVDALLHPRQAGANPYRIVLGEVRCRSLLCIATSLALKPPNPTLQTLLLVYQGCRALADRPTLCRPLPVCFALLSAGAAAPGGHAAAYGGASVGARPRL